MRLCICLHLYEDQAREILDIIEDARGASSELYSTFKEELDRGVDSRLEIEANWEMEIIEDIFNPKEEGDGYL